MWIDNFRFKYFWEYADLKGSFEHNSFGGKQSVL